MVDVIFSLHKRCDNEQHCNSTLVQAPAIENGDSKIRGLRKIYLAGESLSFVPNVSIEASHIVSM
jgi:hypothetical protein